MIEKCLIGIDPDVEKSGVASICKNKYAIKNLSFFELLEYLKMKKEKHINLVVYVECGFLNKSNWHKKSNKSAAYNTKIGEYTGANFETARKIVEMCTYLKITHHQIKPTRSKISNDTFKTITGYTGRTNQEQRDAFMLIYGR